MQPEDIVALKEEDTSIRCVAAIHRFQQSSNMRLSVPNTLCESGGDEKLSHARSGESSSEGTTRTANTGSLTTDSSTAAVSLPSTSLSSGEEASKHAVSSTTTTIAQLNFMTATTSASGVVVSTFSQKRTMEDRQAMRYSERSLSNVSFGDVFGEMEHTETDCTDEETNPKDDATSPFGKQQRDLRTTIDTPPKTLPSSGPAIEDALKPLPPPASAATTTLPVASTAAPGAAATRGSTSGMTTEPSSLAASIQSATGSSVGGSAPRQLYSAIGSLEDPTTNSFLWKRHFAARTTTKYEFPSSRLLAPISPRQQEAGVFPSSFLVPPSTTSISADAKKPAGTSDTNECDNNNIKKKQSTLSAKMTALEAATVSADLSSSRKATPTRATETKTSTKSRPASATHSANDDTEMPSAPRVASRPKSSLRESLQHRKDTAHSQTKSSSRATTKKVTIAPDHVRKKSSRKKKPKELFRPCSDAYTPRMGKKDLKYKPAEMRTPVQRIASPMGTLSRPNFRDALRRVAMIIHQHIVKIEHRFEASGTARRNDGLFSEAMKDAFCEDAFVTPKYKCSMVRVPMARPGMVFGLKRMRKVYEIPSEDEIYRFAERLFSKVQLSSECSIVCLIYVERLMEKAKVPLLACTWRPIFMCGLLLASKVWQDLSSWNIEFANVYPQYSLDSINRLEVQFLRRVKWDLYISSSLHAKYYFALRSLVEKPDFRNRYYRMMGGVDSVQASEARKIQERSTQFKEEVLSQLSRSM